MSPWINKKDCRYDNSGVKYQRHQEPFDFGDVKYYMGVDYAEGPGKLRNPVTGEFIKNNLKEKKMSNPERTFENTLQALNECDARWEGIVLGTVFWARTKCSLCKFKSEDGNADCDSCPIVEFYQQCDKSGYVYHAYRSNQTPENAIQMHSKILDVRTKFLSKYGRVKIFPTPSQKHIENEIKCDISYHKVNSQITFTEEELRHIGSILGNIYPSNLDKVRKTASSLLQPWFKVYDMSSLHGKAYNKIKTFFNNQ